MAVYSSQAQSPLDAHTIQEFISLGGASSAKISYKDLSYIENRDNFEFIVKNTITDFLYELKKVSYRINLSDMEVIKYKYNPKRLAYDLYGTPRVYYVILLMNDMCDIHQFDLASKTLLRYHIRICLI